MFQTLFPALDYFTRLAQTNRLALEYQFHPCLCSGPDSIDGIMQGFKKYQNFIMVDDTTSQQTFSNGVGFFRRDVYTVFIVAAYRHDDLADREQKLMLCRQIFRQFHSRLLHDRDTSATTASRSSILVMSIPPNFPATPTTVSRGFIS